MTTNILNTKPMMEYMNTEFDIVEKFNRDNALKLLEIECLDNDTKFRLKKYLSYSTSTGTALVKYKCNDIGRLDISIVPQNTSTKKKGTGTDVTCTVQSYMKRSVKGALCVDYYKDIDIVNCHPVIILQVFQNYQKV